MEREEEGREWRVEMRREREKEGRGREKRGGRLGGDGKGKEW